MESVNTTHLLQELETNISNNDSLKAAIILSYLDQTQKETQNSALTLLAQANPVFIFQMITKTEREYPHVLLSYTQLEELLITKVLEAPEQLAEHIQMDSPSTTLIKAAGKADLHKSRPVLESLLNSEDNPETVREILVSLGRIADPGSVNSLSPFLYRPENSIVSEAIKALANIGTPTAIKRLAEALGKNHQTDLLILDILSRVQDSISLNKLNETLSSHYAHLRNYAQTKLVSIGEKTVPLLSENLMYDDPDLRIHSLQILGEIGDKSAYPAMRKLLNEYPADPNVRFAAYEALGRLSVGGGAHTLGTGLSDPEEQVRIAAAAAIELNLNKLLLSGIANMLRSEEESSQQIVASIVDAQAFNTFFGLLDTPIFRKEAIDYLRERAPADLREMFRHKLEKSGYENISRQLSTKSRPDIQLPLALAVDDSAMILNIYKNALYNLGFEPIVFSNPQKALEWLQANRPAAMFTDLNMPEMTGVELIRQTREIHTTAELPIIMITTQNEVQDNQDALKAGVSAIGHKPFTADSLQKILDKATNG